MIIRIVKLGFKPAEIDAFLADFELHKTQIRNFEGCTHLTLLRDVQQPYQFFTYSYWKSEAHLNNYRNSSLFQGIWAVTKPRFSQPAEAWSTEAIAETNHLSH